MVITQLKHVNDILLAFIACELRLTSDKMFAAQGVAYYRQVRDVADAPCQLLALVVAALSQTLTTQRDWQ